jgi:hypothetical protein
LLASLLGVLITNSPCDASYTACIAKKVVAKAVSRHGLMQIVCYILVNFTTCAVTSA